MGKISISTVLDIGLVDVLKLYNATIDIESGYVFNKTSNKTDGNQFNSVVRLTEINIIALLD